ncbi:dipeptide epimerase [Bacillus sp. 165]|uniref:dipeptide epimerase n=1 Tax=Bacillus sp. 165 TaxID=1529117 RepID=UPI001ADB1C32|nr:dipeptide epimerase [Bacillus sp. 165]MBO9130427.1 dipeptide epimerase [Bacillus sp. 165]
MRIQSLDVTRRTIPLVVPFKTALRTATEVESIEVELTLDTGIKGRGAAAPTYVITGDSAQSIEAALLGPIQSALINADLEHFQETLRKVQACCIGNMSAKAAADIALHDAYSKAINIPLYAFLGGNKALSTCMTIGVDSVEKMTADAKKSVMEGFDVLKVKVGASPELDIARIEAIRTVVPAHVKLRLDANQGWSAKQAVQLIQEMENRSFGIELVEQPVPAYDLDGLKFVTERVATPIMADESMFSPRDAMKLVTGRYIDLLNIKLMKCGGINEAWKIASIAETHGITCMVGSMMEASLSVSAAAHFAAAHPNVRYFDLDAPLWLSEKPSGLIYNGKHITLPKEPGLGIKDSTIPLS